MGEQPQRETLMKELKGKTGDLGADKGRVATAALRGLEFLGGKIAVLIDRIEQAAVTNGKRHTATDQSIADLKGRVTKVEQDVKGVPQAAAAAAQEAVNSVDRTSPETEEVHRILTTEVKIEGRKLSGLELIEEMFHAFPPIVQKWVESHKPQKPVVDLDEVARTVAETMEVALQKLLAKPTVALRNTLAQLVRELLPGLLAEQKANKAAIPKPEQEVPANVDPDVDAAVEAGLPDDPDIVHLRAPTTEPAQEAEEQSLRLDVLEKGLKDALVERGFDLGEEESTDNKSPEERIENLETGLKTLFEDLGYDMSDQEPDTSKSLQERVANLEIGLKKAKDEMGNEKEGDQ
jgi:hypothetical protein